MFLNKNFSYKLLCLFFCISFLFPPFSYSQESLPLVKEVEISGNRFITSARIRRQLGTQPGKKYSRIDINKDIKRLYQLQFFSKISVDVEELPTSELKVIFKVVEKPAIEDITFFGNKEVKIKTLKKQINSREGELLNEKIIADDIVKIRDYYAGKGYKSIDVTHEVEIDEIQGIANIEFRISEGKKIKIKKIRIIGASQIKEKKVLKIMKTKRKHFFSSGLYDEKKFKEDLERIKAFYYQQGFVDIKINDVRETIVKNGKRVIIDIEIDEGKQYRIGEINIEGNSVFTEEELLDVSNFKPGDLYLPENLSKDLRSVKNKYLKDGYIDAKVGVDTYAGVEEDVLNIRYKVIENEVAFVDKIQIQGNAKTKDKVVRRELNIRPGEKYDGIKLEVAKSRLSNLGLFKNVDVYPDPTDKGREKDLLIDVEEDRTGELSFGAGFSSVERLIGFLEVSQSNFDLFNWPSFTGDGQKLKLRAEFGSRKEELLLDFTEPWLFEKRLLFGFRVFSRERDFQNSDFSEDRKGFLLRMAKPLFEYVRGEIRYSFEDVEVLNVDDDASEILKAQEGERQVGKVGINLKRDVRNSFFNASRGSRVSLDLELAGVGGDTEYHRAVYEQDLYFNPWLNHVLIASLRIGAIEEYGDTDDVPIFDRFFLGGQRSIRGFDNRDVGPHDDQGEPLGGKFLYNGTLEYVVPIVSQFSLAGFFDFGYLFEDYDKISDAPDKIVGSLGVGVRIQLPIGIPLRFDYGIPVITDEFHEGKNGEFTFDIGHRF